MSEPVTLGVVGGRPITANRQRRAGHWSQQAGSIRWWREAARLTARAELKGRPLSTPVRVEAWELRPAGSRGREADVGAIAPAVKAAVDGIVDAGCLPDDSPRYLVELTFLPAQRGDTAGLALRFTPAPRRRRLT